ncbi:MAG: hypothetical protein E6K81_04450 [Candidatus Eisenbacteria bacterium]|uniref:S-adenosylmethionine-dependent methyltransferase Rv2258c-like winged HTH domain-containing protein n=1 Tax=Eiseniibacteriota bacterium TaxID=2212470 RepID=A0A538UC62_UNCEI|nr:MAG: hypothetical protein E6K81_04450 [Candidatus Eisenbacteria bacterium]
MTTHESVDGGQANDRLTQRHDRDRHSRIELVLAELGTRLGLFEELANHGPETCPELAARTGLDEGYVYEWLAAMSERSYLEYDVRTRRFALVRFRLPGGLPQQHDPPRQR